VRVGITGVSQPAAASFELPAGVSFSDPDTVLPDVLKRLDRQSRLVVLCLEGERTWIETTAKRYADRVDLVLSGDRTAATADYSYQGDPPLLNNYDQGRRIGVVSVDCGSGFTFSAATVDLTDRFVDDAAVVAYLEQTFRPQLKERFFGKMKTDLEQLYLPPDSCKPCHELEYANYLASQHYRSLKSLYDKSQLYNPDCMTCHVVYDSNQDQLQPVDCVSCHSNITEEHLWKGLTRT